MEKEFNSVSIYRLPGATRLSFVAQKDSAESLDSFDKIGGEGFVIAPFVISESTPVLIIRPETSLQFDNLSLIPQDIAEAINNCCALNIVGADSCVDSKMYGNIFRKFHEELENGRFHKLVLARSITKTCENPKLPMSLFVEACNRYPDAFITLFSTPRSGTWIVATPEILLENEGSRWHTIALAGTMRKSDTLAEWSNKDRREQQIVALHIKNILQSITSDIEETGPTTVDAGNLVHLRTDFRFSLPSKNDISILINTLHPTPAVCGEPKDEARKFIISNESSPRTYYSGFCGPITPNGNTHLYVSLRCMRIRGTKFDLYAGGGILPESTEQKEWDETTAKMETISSIIYV